jgi:hypothetical protein
VPSLSIVVDGGQNGGDDAHDRFLGAASRSDAVEQGLQVAAFLFDRRPGALHQRGFDPGAALAQAIGSTLAGTLVVARACANPSNGASCDKAPKGHSNFSPVAHRASPDLQRMKYWYFVTARACRGVCFFLVVHRASPDLQRMKRWYLITIPSVPLSLFLPRATPWETRPQSTKP